MNKLLHTPTPWAIQESEGVMWISEIGKRDRSIIYPRGSLGGKEIVELAKKNAEFIVRACNLHDELVAAVRSFISYDESDQDEGVTTMLNYADAIELCRAVLAKVDQA